MAIELKRQQAFLNDRKLLKGGLHCHTTRSDGEGDPGEVIRLHKQKGYDFLAITDHRCYNYTNFAPEAELLMIPGMEFDNTFVSGAGGFRTFHTVVIGPEKADGNGYAQDETMPSGTACDQYAYQAYLDKMHEKNNLTVYCHPEWSSTPARYFEALEGNFAMEIWNSGCAMENQMDTDAAYWDELLGQGKRIFGVATDDGHAMEQHGVGWVRVNCEKNIASVLEALKNGAFYSSCGPEIYDFYVEKDKAFLKCSPCKAVRLHSDRHPTKIKTDKDGKITEAVFELTGDWAGSYDYIRISVIDTDGQKAWTNPIFLND